jgi:hypothetical protein
MVLIVFRFALVLWNDGAVSRLEGAVLVVAALELMFWLYRRSPIFHASVKEEDGRAASGLKITALLVGSAVVIVAGAELLVYGAGTGRIRSTSVASTAQLFRTSGGRGAGVALHPASPISAAHSSGTVTRRALMTCLLLRLSRSAWHRLEKSEDPPMAQDWTLPGCLCQYCRSPLPDRPNRGSRRRFCSTKCRWLGWLAVEVYRARVLGLLAEPDRERREGAGG